MRYRHEFSQAFFRRPSKRLILVLAAIPAIGATCWLGMIFYFATVQQHNVEQLLKQGFQIAYATETGEVHFEENPSPNTLWRNARFDVTEVRAALDLEVTRESLSQITSFHRLELLSIMGPIATDDFTSLAPLKHLRELRLHDTRLTATSVSRLLEAFACQDLSDLDLSNNIFDDAVGPVLKRFHSLKRLNLSETNVSDKIFDFIGSLQLESLILDATSITDDGAEAIAKMSSLETVSISRTYVGARGAQSFAKLRSLQCLTLAWTAIDDDVADTIRQLVGLRLLDLSGTKITDKCVDAITVLRDLEFVDLHNTRTTDKSLDYLGALPSLKTLDVYGTGMTKKAIDEFKSKHAGIFVIYRRPSYGVPFLLPGEQPWIPGQERWQSDNE